jgi:dATP/dGTP diphosphohydrolase
MPNRRTVKLIHQRGGSAEFSFKLPCTWDEGTKTRRVDGQRSAFEFLESVAEVLTRAAARDGPYNRKRGQKDFFFDAWNHAFEHLQKFKEGDTSEDHLGHLACNAAFMIWAVKNRIISQEHFGHPR